MQRYTNEDILAMHLSLIGEKQHIPFPAGIDTLEARVRNLAPQSATGYLLGPLILPHKNFGQYAAIPRAMVWYFARHD
jgi:hypothetical protein